MINDYYSPSTQKMIQIQQENQEKLSTDGTLSSTSIYEASYEFL